MVCYQSDNLSFLNFQIRHTLSNSLQGKHSTKQIQDRYEFLKNEIAHKLANH